MKIINIIKDKIYNLFQEDAKSGLEQKKVVK